MVDAASNQRDLVASKLDESVRQLVRYVECGAKSRRILESRCDKIESLKNELIEEHHRYGKKAGTPATDNGMKEYVTPKLDAAEDILNRALEALDTLDDTEKMDNKKVGVLAAEAEAEMHEEMLLFIEREASKILEVIEPTDDDVISVENVLIDMEKKEVQLHQAYSALRSLLDEGEMEPFRKKEIKWKQLLSTSYARMKLFVQKRKKILMPRAEKGSTSNDLRTEKIKPPKFSGDIRSYARFKADFDAIVVPVYKNENMRTYVLRESCLTGSAYEVAKNLDSSEEIWARLNERYGDSIEVVDSVIKELKGTTINKHDQDRGVVELIDVLEKGVRDLTAIKKRSEIANAFTVKLLEQKLPRRVMMKWLDEEDRCDEEDRFEAIFKFLKQERKRLEKIIQQNGSSPMGKECGRRRQINAFGDRNSDKQKNNSCLLHPDANHLTRKCRLFLSKTVAERTKIVEDLQGCKLCLSSTHKGKQCPWQSKWEPCRVNRCDEYHSRLLHVPQKQSCNVTSDKDRTTLLLVQQVKSVKDDVTVFWDSGSSISLVTNDYAERHGFTGIEVSYELVTLVNEVKYKTRRCSMFPSLK